MTPQQPILKTQRLVLRLFNLTDAPRVQHLAGAREVADMTITIPHPYPNGVAESWIASHPMIWQSRKGMIYAITRIESDELIGCVSITRLSSTPLTLDEAELSYWIGRAYWGQGFCTEACAAMLAFEQKECRFQTLVGRHLTHNPASGRVLEKCGFHYVDTSIETIGRLKGQSFRLYRLTRCESN